MDQKLTLNDGTVLEPAHAIANGGILWIYLDGEITLAEAFELLIDQDKTCRITAEEYGVTAAYENYTDLFCITMEDDGSVNAGLKRAVD